MLKSKILLVIPVMLLTAVISARSSGRSNEATAESRTEVITAYAGLKAECEEAINSQSVTTELIAKEKEMKKEEIVRVHPITGETKAFPVIDYEMYAIGEDETGDIVFSEENDKDMKSIAASAEKTGTMIRIHPLTKEECEFPVIDYNQIQRGEDEGGDADDNVTESNLSRAVVAPTSYAPSYWYNVNHYWTAVYYTYSSYIFDTSENRLLDVAADAPFTVEFYSPVGTYLAQDTPSYDNVKGKYYGAYFWFPSDSDYYLIIRNNSGSPITSGAWYWVGGSYDD